MRFYGETGVKEKKQTWNWGLWRSKEVFYQSKICRKLSQAGGYAFVLSTEHRAESRMGWSVTKAKKGNVCQKGSRVTK